MLVTLSWTFTDPGVPAIVIEGFIVERTIQGGAFEIWKTIADPSARQTTDGTLTSGITAQYRMKTYGTISGVPMQSSVTETLTAIDDRDPPLSGAGGPRNPAQGNYAQAIFR